MAEVGGFFLRPDTSGHMSRPPDPLLTIGHGETESPARLDRGGPARHHRGVLRVECSCGGGSDDLDGSIMGEIMVPFKVQLGHIGTHVL